MKTLWVFGGCMVAVVLSSCAGTGGSVVGTPSGYPSSRLSAAQTVGGSLGGGYGNQDHSSYATSSLSSLKSKQRNYVYGDTDSSRYSSSSLATPLYSSLSSKRRSSAYGSTITPFSTFAQTEEPKKRNWFSRKQEAPSYSGLGADSYGGSSYSKPYGYSSSSSSKPKSGGFGSSQPYNPLSTNTYTVTPKQFGGYNVTDSYGRRSSVQSDGFGGWKSTSSTGRTAVTGSDGFGGYTTRYGNGSYSTTSRDPFSNGYTTRHSNGSFSTTPASSFRTNSGSSGSLLKGFNY